MPISVLYENESYEIRNHKNRTSGTIMERFGKNKTGTSMEHCWNASHDNIQKESMW